MGIGRGGACGAASRPMLTAGAERAARARLQVRELSAPEGAAFERPPSRNSLLRYGSLSDQPPKPCVVTYMTRFAWSILR
jgi:hypothetical protein